MARVGAGQTLFLDADDTLWENNVYFERAIASFISYLDHQVHTAGEVREHLNHAERATIATHGYGIGSFRKSLVACFEELTAVPVTPQHHERLVRFANSIAEHEMEVLDGVCETLEELASRHELVLVTKGDEAEQTDKLERSGLRGYFGGVEVLREKHEAAYRELGKTYGRATGMTWMIGNSPRSDVNPALAAGLHAVFVPHNFTWVLEHEVLGEPPDGQTLLQLRRFRDLLDHF